MKNIERRQTALQLWETELLSGGSVVYEEDKMSSLCPHPTNIEKVSMVSFNIDENTNSTFLDGLEDKKANWRGSWVSLVPSVFTTVQDNQFTYALVFLGIIVIVIFIFVIILVLYNVFVPYNQTIDDCGFEKPSKNHFTTGGNFQINVFKQKQMSKIKSS